MKVYNDRVYRIEKEIAEVKKDIDSTYNIDKQIRLSKCFVMLYTLKREALEL